MPIDRTFIQAGNFDPAVKAALNKFADAFDAATDLGDIDAEARLEALETAVGDGEAGLVADVAALETVVGSGETGLVGDVADHEARIEALENPPAP